MRPAVAAASALSPAAPHAAAQHPTARKLGTTRAARPRVGDGAMRLRIRPQTVALVLLAHMAAAAGLVWLGRQPTPLPAAPLIVQMIEPPKPPEAPIQPPEPPKMAQLKRSADPVPAPRPSPQSRPTPAAPTPPQQATPPTPAPPPVMAAAPNPSNTAAATVAEPSPAPAAPPAPPAPPTPSPPPAAKAPPAPAPVAPPRFDADYLDNPKPAYPAVSRKSGEQGTVMLRVLVDPQGAPERLEVRDSSGHERLDRAALSAVGRWRFVPARQGDKPVSAWVLVPIHFSLNEE